MWRGLFRFSSSSPITNASADHDVSSALTELLASGVRPIAAFVNAARDEVSVVVEAEAAPSGPAVPSVVGALRLLERLDHDEAPQTVPAEAAWRLSTPREGLRSLRETDWSFLRITSTKAFVTFSRGVREQLHEATAAFDESGRLRVTVIVGTAPDDAGGVVPLGAVIDHALVDLPFVVVDSRHGPS